MAVYHHMTKELRQTFWWLANTLTFPSSTSLRDFPLTSNSNVQMAIFCCRGKVSWAPPTIRAPYTSPITSATIGMDTRDWHDPDSKPAHESNLRLMWRLLCGYWLVSCTPTVRDIEIANTLRGSGLLSIGVTQFHGWGSWIRPKTSGIPSL